MRTAVRLTPTAVFAAFRVAAGNRAHLAVHFTVRADEGERVQVEGVGSLDALTGHVRIEEFGTDEANRTWGRVVFHPATGSADEEQTPAFGIELSAPQPFVLALATIAEKGQLPPAIEVETDGLTADFSGPDVTWRWARPEQTELAVLWVDWTARLDARGGEP
jgi:hypothetical protein